jgi:hypothetical protein
VAAQRERYQVLNTFQELTPFGAVLKVLKVFNKIGFTIDLGGMWNAMKPGETVFALMDSPWGTTPQRFGLMKALLHLGQPEADMVTMCCFNAGNLAGESSWVARRCLSLLSVLRANAKSDVYCEAIAAQKEDIVRHLVAFCWILQGMVVTLADNYVAVCVDIVNVAKSKGLRDVFPPAVTAHCDRLHPEPWSVNRDWGDVQWHATVQTVLDHTKAKLDDWTSCFWELGKRIVAARETLSVAQTSAPTTEVFNAVIEQHLDDVKRRIERDKTRALIAKTTLVGDGEGRAIQAEALATLSFQTRPPSAHARRRPAPGIQKFAADQAPGAHVIKLGEPGDGDWVFPDSDESWRWIQEAAFRLGMLAHNAEVAKEVAQGGEPWEPDFPQDPREWPPFCRGVTSFAKWVIGSVPRALTAYNFP